MKAMSVAKIVVIAFLIGSAGLATSCRKQGPAETAGSKIDDAAQKMKDKVDPPGPAEKAGRKVDKVLGED